MRVRERAHDFFVRVTYSRVGSERFLSSDQFEYGRVATPRANGNGVILEGVTSDFLEIT